MSRINHPNIIQLHRVLKSQTKYFLILDLIRGKDLSEIIGQNGCLSESTARIYFHQIIDAIDFLHRNGIIHRDIKPDNILIDKNDKAYLIDFGLSARNITQSDLFTDMLGTPNYLAPEVITETPYRGQSVDLYAAGLILYVMLTGEVPFHADSSQDVIQNIILSELYIPNFISDAAAKLIRRLTHRNPRLRYTIEDVRKDEWFSEDYTSSAAGEIIDREIQIENANIQILQPQQVMEYTDQCSMTPCSIEKEQNTETKNCICSPFAFSVISPLDALKRNLNKRIESLGGCIKDEENSSENATFKLGLSSLAIKIDIFPLVDTTHIIRIINIHGENSDFDSIATQLKKQLCI
ncbi:CAMK family protein kinase [Trichomonas vaginalis G3]|uniref:non-specific serine/threonine protein kinase n=1 Tax=Trichomonas vaginalis (strain ATCC PRA-98 / G3) TaxID=412133 RepID=A2F8Z0_TRIV3|nr:protein serine/threonine kinase protein [Trichomonas vaginalis G3]EAX98617.1 CAMK family protein kinase [Trichomonas vaginalis G3]KAI5513414.1 protein serine/threonine kinase protein [Trichomonas vaginalis G3]|eukprot:XP_001311547.1 CAMK family protein kinase [Trichomonas vaginalis G3]